MLHPDGCSCVSCETVEDLRRRVALKREELAALPGLDALDPTATLVTSHLLMFAVDAKAACADGQHLPLINMLGPLRDGVLAGVDALKPGSTRPEAIMLRTEAALFNAAWNYIMAAIHLHESQKQEDEN